MIKEWEYISTAKNAYDDLYGRNSLRRFPVPGGWIYQVADERMSGYENGTVWAKMLVFVPLPRLPERGERNK